MKAIILGAGRGTRVRPLTYSVPKPMIPIFNKPVMEFLVRLLARHGVSEIMVNTSYMSQDIEGYFRDGSNFGVEMAYSFEGRLIEGKLIDEPIGSAGALRKIQDHSGFFDKTFVVLCGDAIIDLDLTRMEEFHRRKGALATISLEKVPREQVHHYGVVVTDADERIVQFQEKPTVEEAKSNTINTGIYIFEPEIIDRIPAGQTYDIGGQLFPALAAENAPLYGTSLPFQWLDIGKVSDYYQVMQAALTGGINGFSVPGRELAPGIWVGANVRIDLAHSTIVPPVYIGGSTSIENGATIVGPSMIGPGCVIEAGASVNKSVIFDYTRVGSYTQVNGMMICGGYCVKSDGTVVDLEQSMIDWVIADARSPKQAPTVEQLELLEMLQGIDSGDEP